MTSYGFKHICMEEIINTDLPRKVSDVVKVETSREIRELLEVCHSMRCNKAALEVFL